MTIGATQTAESVNTENLISQTDNEPSNEENLSNVSDNEPVNDDTAVEDEDKIIDENKNDDQNGDNPENLILGKFKSQDDLIKAYESSQSEGSRMAQELAEVKKKAEIADKLEKQQLEIAKSYGFDSVDAMQQHQQQLQTNSEIAKFEANQYAQFLNLCNDPEGVRDLLVLYAQNPTPELKKAIEDEAGFPIEVHKQVAEQMVQLKADLKRQNEQALYNQEATKVKTYLENVTREHPEEFKNKDFVTLYGEAFKVLGADLDSNKFIGLLNSLKQSWINEYTSNMNIQKENNDAINAVEGLSPQSQKQTSTSQEKNILDMSEEEMLKEIKKYK